jgi:hypothetical protein
MFVAASSQVQEGHAFMELVSATDATRAVSELSTQTLLFGKVTIDFADTSDEGDLADPERSFHQQQRKIGEGKSVS